MCFREVTYTKVKVSTYIANGICPMYLFIAPSSASIRSSIISSVPDRIENIVDDRLPRLERRLILGNPSLLANLVKPSLVRIKRVFWGDLPL